MPGWKFGPAFLFHLKEIKSSGGILINSDIICNKILLLKCGQVDKKSLVLKNWKISRSDGKSARRSCLCLICSSLEELFGEYAMNAVHRCSAMTDIKRNARVFLVSIAMLSVLAGCGSSKPKLGDAIRAQGVELATIGDQWTEGDGLIDEGREQVEQGRDMIDEGENLIETGRDNIRRGQQAKQQAELSYREKTGQELPVN